MHFGDKVFLAANIDFLVGIVADAVVFARDATGAEQGAESAEQDGGPETRRHESGD